MAKRSLPPDQHIVDSAESASVLFLYFHVDAQGGEEGDAMLMTHMNEVVALRPPAASGREIVAGDCSRCLHHCVLDISVGVRQMPNGVGNAVPDRKFRKRLRNLKSFLKENLGATLPDPLGGFLSKRLDFVC